MLRFLPNYGRPEDRSALQDLIARSLAAQASSGSRAANQILIDGIKLEVMPTLDEEFCREALHYHSGLLYAHLEQPELAADHFEQSRTLAGTGGDVLFSEHRQQSIALESRRQVAQKRGLPTIVLASMPRSASTSLTQTIGATLDMPEMRASAGRFPNYALVPRWLSVCLSGGAVLHDHFAASPYNLQVLRQNGVREIFVLIRDPRAAASSYSRLIFRSRTAEPSAEEIDAMILTVFLKGHGLWLQKWVDLAVDPAADIKINWVLYPLVTSDIGSAMRQIFARLLPEYPALSPYMESGVAEVKSNFVVGSDEHWRSRVSDATRERMWAAMPAGIAALLDLQP